MQIAGIVAEYNPFHKGHRYQIEATRSAGATHIVAVMSGNYVQRGDTALLSKQARARMAVLCGVDLVVELPTPWAMSTAQNFALGGISVLSSLGCADTLSFGCECGDASLLQKAAAAISHADTKPYLDDFLSRGLGFAEARQKAVEKAFGKDTAAVLSSPNNTLAVEYLAAAERLGAELKPLAVTRIGAGHDKPRSVNDPYASASELRRLILEGDLPRAADSMPGEAADILFGEKEKGHIASVARLESAILARLRTMRASDFAGLPDISEGLEHRIFAAVRNAADLEGLYAAVKTRRYSHARIRRLILSAFLNLPNRFFGRPVPYIRVLGMNSRGQEILRIAKSTARAPVILRGREAARLGPDCAALFELECRATDLYDLSTEIRQACGREFTENVVIL